MAFALLSLRKDVYFYTYTVAYRAEMRKTAYLAYFSLVSL